MVQNKFIVQLYDVFESDESIDLVFEYMSGDNLCEWVKKNGALKESQAAKIMFVIFEVLHYLHEKSIIHRDIKMENIMLQQIDASTKDKNLEFTEFKIIDFGLSIQFNKVQPAKTSCGSITYAGNQLS